jgi:D-alanyl-D-alanine carboxypeptidase
MTLKAHPALKALVLTGLLSLLGATPASAASTASSVTDAVNFTRRLDTMLSAERQRTGVPSITVLVRKDGKTVYEYHEGLADVEQNVPASANTVYALASVSKSIAAQTVLRLVALGRLSLDDTVAARLPDYQGPAREVTVRQLLTHTSGLQDYIFLPSLMQDWSRDFDRGEPTRAFASMPLQFKPGTQFRYTNSGYHLLGLILEKVTGRPYEQVVNETVLNLYGLDRIRFGAREPIMPGRARGYLVSAGGKLTNAPLIDADVTLACGAYYSTAEDLARFIEAINDPARTPKAVRDLMFTKSTLPDGTVLNYLPAGLIESDFFGYRKLAHAGDIPGFKAQATYYPSEQLSIVVLQNGTGAVLSPSTLEHRVARAVLGIADPVIKDLPLSAQEAKRYKGSFRLFPMSWGPQMAVVGYVDGKLTMSFRGTVRGDSDTTFPVLNQGGGVFVAPFDAEMVMRFVGKPAATNVSFDYLDGRVVAKRVQEFAQ